MPTVAESGFAGQTARRQKKLATEAFDVIGNTLEAFGKYLKAKFVKWAKVVKESGARVE